MVRSAGRPSRDVSPFKPAADADSQHGIVALLVGPAAVVTLTVVPAANVTLDLLVLVSVALLVVETLAIGISYSGRNASSVTDRLAAAA